ncbi:MAG: GTPase ObgE [Acidobacteria bacterium]|jgi:GTP-binding protein|nr:GTPase ObgE [Acidobacteriota bacterium]
MFIDRAIVSFRAGDGGDGSHSFRREKFIPRGGPDGGDGGKGGDIVLVSSPMCQSLTDFKYKRQFEAEDGGAGSRRKCTGRNGADIVLQVPAGTVVKTFPDEKLIFDFDRLGLEFVLARGGKGGRGNVHFKSSVNQAPRRSEKGEKGEEIKVVLELKLIASAGLVGLPNAGKSTLISRISAARPKIADYPFTTLAPNLGVVDFHGRSMIVADIPGILEGAHRGEGMGLEFLRHIERTRVLLFVIDVSPYAALPPLQTFEMLENELRQYHPQLLQKSLLVLANKIDLAAEDRGGIDALRNFCRRRKIPFVEISALKATHLEKMKKILFSFHEPD